MLSPQPLCCISVYADTSTPFDLAYPTSPLNQPRKVALSSWPKHMPHQPAAPKPTMTSSYPASDAWSTARRIAADEVMSWIINGTGCSSS